MVDVLLTVEHRNPDDGQVRKVMQPSFETPRLLLRPRTMADFDACLAMDRDPAVTRYIPGPWNDPEKHEAFVRERINTPYGDGLGYWSVFAKEQPNGFMGWILLIPSDGEGPEIEIGWRLVQSAWGKGFASEAARPVVEHAFRTIGLKRIVADIMPVNLPSVRIAEKIGMKPIRAGETVPEPWKRYVMTKSDFSDMVARQAGG